MTAPAQAAPAEPFFLETADGQRFCLFHPPVGACHGAVLYVAPFGEEMNKARRMAALQARALAAQGYGVLSLDLYGCGDSSGELRDARWETWLADLHAGCQWLSARLGLPVTLWGLRLGALLALDYAAAHPVSGLLLWQPVQNGGAYLKQFLRLLTASDMINEGSGRQTSAGPDPRTALLGGATLEVAGYELPSALAAAIDSKDAGKLPPRGCPVHWFELTPAPDRPLPPAASRLADAWRKEGAEVHLHQVTGLSFWATQEIEICPALVSATAAVCHPSNHAISRTSA